MKYQLIRVWKAGEFLLKLWDTHRSDRYGKSILAYKLYDNGRLIFKGDDFHCSPLRAIDSNETVASLLAFLSLKPGDTDPEWFEGFSPAQLTWCRCRAEELSWYVEELEGRGVSQHI
jgi:hypothetical protein